MHIHRKVNNHTQVNARRRSHGAYIWLLKHAMILWKIIACFLCARWVILFYSSVDLGPIDFISHGCISSHRRCMHHRDRGGRGRREDSIPLVSVRDYFVKGREPFPHPRYSYWNFSKPIPLAVGAPPPLAQIIPQEICVRSWIVCEGGGSNRAGSCTRSLSHLIYYRYHEREPFLWGNCSGNGWGREHPLERRKTAVGHCSRHVPHLCIPFSFPIHPHLALTVVKYTSKG